MKALHRHFCQWCTAQETVGCMLDTFYALVEDEGFRIEDGLVYRLVRREELEWARRVYGAGSRAGNP